MEKRKLVNADGSVTFMAVTRLKNQDVMPEVRPCTTLDPVRKARCHHTPGLGRQCARPLHTATHTELFEARVQRVPVAWQHSKGCCCGDTPAPLTPRPPLQLGVLSPRGGNVSLSRVLQKMSSVNEASRHGAENPTEEEQERTNREIDALVGRLSKARCRAPLRACRVDLVFASLVAAWRGARPRPSTPWAYTVRPSR